MCSFSICSLLRLFQEPMELTNTCASWRKQRASKEPTVFHDQKGPQKVAVWKGNPPFFWEILVGEILFHCRYLQYQL